jgi:hypothetical protein
MTDDQLPEEQSNEVSDGTFAFAGKALEKFSWTRQTAWQRMQDASLAENDALMVFLCLTPIEEVKAIRGQKAEANYLDAMGDWLDSLGVTIHKDNYGRQEINRIANTIARDISLAQFNPDFKSKGEPPSPNVTG